MEDAGSYNAAIDCESLVANKVRKACYEISHKHDK